MPGSEENTVLARLVEMRVALEREIPTRQREIDSLVTSFQNVADNVKSEAQSTIQLQGKLKKVKWELKEAEDALANSLSAKTRKEARQVALMESMSVMKTRVEELKRTVEEQRGRKDEYAAILSQHSEALTAREEQCNQNREHQNQIQEVISWYNKVLGFRIECGHGVKFVFTNINPKDPNKEYSVTILHENKIYTLLKCDPHLSGTKVLVKELNESNGLFRFVRSMREKFVEAAVHGTSDHDHPINENSSTISPSAPVAPVLTAQTYESPLEEKRLKIAQSNSNSKKQRKRDNILSPTSSLRRSARLKVNK